MIQDDGVSIDSEIRVCFNSIKIFGSWLILVIQNFISSLQSNEKNEKVKCGAILWQTCKLQHKHNCEGKNFKLKLTAIHRGNNMVILEEK